MRLTFILLFIANVVRAQDPFSVYLEPMDIPGLPGAQSYVYGTDGNKWLVFGGRIDGLHRRQPFAAFDEAGKNFSIMVIDPVSPALSIIPLEGLAEAIVEQMSSTNLEFLQDGNMLYATGGYGWSPSNNEFVTYPFLLAIDVPCAIASVEQGLVPVDCIRQFEYDELAVTGGQLRKIGDVFHLVGGQKFTGAYNPMGPDMGPGFVQEYTNQVRRFTIEDDGVDIAITFLEPFTDADYLHRRDYNVLPQIMPDGAEGLTAFSGVFQYDNDIPWLHCVNIREGEYEIDLGFSQYYNHYHCATLGLYAAESNEMHNLFFGGIAQYYEEDGELVQDNDVPFVKTISRVTRIADGSMTEYKLPFEMPDYLGAGAEFIPLAGIPQFGNEVMKWDDMTADSTLVGYIYGGIHSSEANVFWINDGSQSHAASVIFRVYLIRDNAVGTHEINEQSREGLHMQVYPNPNAGQFTVSCFLEEQSDLWLSIADTSGKVLSEDLFPNLGQGINTIDKWLEGLKNGGTYYVTLRSKHHVSTQKVIVRP